MPSIFFYLPIIIWIPIVLAQNLFSIFQNFGQNPFFMPPQQQKYLPPVGRVGRSPNEKLQACCAKLPEADQDCKNRFCNFDAMQSNQVLFFLSTCNPRGSTVGQMWDCASSRADHRECCLAKGVAPGCIAYCEAMNGVPTDVSKYLFCLNDFNKIRDCFVRHLENHPNLKGDL